MWGVCPCSTRWRESEIARLSNQEEGRWASRCRKLWVSFRKHKSVGRSPYSANCIWQATIKEHTLTWDDTICISMPFSKTFQWESLNFESPPQISVPYVKVGSTKVLHTRRELSSHHVRNSNYWWFPLQKLLTKTFKRVNLSPSAWCFKVAMWVEIDPEVHPNITK